MCLAAILDRFYSNGWSNKLKLSFLVITTQDLSNDKSQKITNHHDFDLMFTALSGLNVLIDLWTLEIRQYWPLNLRNKTIFSCLTLASLNNKVVNAAIPISWLFQTWTNKNVNVYVIVFENIQNTEYRICIVYDNMDICLLTAYTFLSRWIVDIAI